MDKLISGVCGVAAGFYLINVVINGNTKPLLEKLKEEGGYIEFLVALYALYLLHEYGPLKNITSTLTVTAVTAVVLNMASKTDTGAVLAEFGKGNISMTDAAKQIFGYKD